MKNDAFANLIRERSRSALSWERFLELPLPEGPGAKETWSVLQGIFHHSGISCPISMSNDEIWYTKTLELSELTETLARECSANSFAGKTISQSTGRPFLADMRVEDALASSTIDGLGGDGTLILEALRYEHEPTNDNVRIIFNTCKAEDALDELVDKPFTPALIENLAALISKNLRGDVQLAKPFLARSAFDLPEAPPLESEREALLERICAYANLEIGDRYDHPVVRCLLLNEVIQGSGLFASISAQVGRLVSKLFAKKNDLPVLAALPWRRAHVEWKNEAIRPPHVICTVEDIAATIARSHHGQSVDITLQITAMCQLVLIELNRLKEAIASREARDNKARDLLSADQEINHRQRSIIMRALRSPSATFTIRYHQVNQNLAYSTARHDLIDLVDKGYLGMTPEGRAFIFKAAPDLETIISKQNVTA